MSVELTPVAIGGGMMVVKPNSGLRPPQVQLQCPFCGSEENVNIQFMKK